MAQEISRILADAAALDYTGLMTVKGDIGQPSTVYLAAHASDLFRHAISQPVPRGQGLSWRSLNEQRPIFIEHHQRHDGANPVFVQAGVSAVAYIPVIPESRPHHDALLFIACWLGGKDTWSVEDRTLLEAAARTFKVAVEREEQLKKLEQAALSDELTRLGNRRRFEADLKSHHARARRHKSFLAVMVLDLDGLKEVNDHMGHEAGDRLLQTFAKHLQNNMRDDDHCYRLGGDEFAVILPDCATESGLALQERMELVMAEVRQEGFPDTGVSLGVAFFPEERSSAEDLVRLADERMYHMKERHHRKDPRY